MRRKINRYTLLFVPLLGAIALLYAIGGALAAPPTPEPPYPELPEVDVFARPPDAARVTAATAALPTPSDPIPLPDPTWRVGVLTDGLVTLDYATLNAAGVPVAGADLDAFHLTWRGQAVALDVEDADDDGIFDPGDGLLFYGEKFHGTIQDEKYTDENVYWLSVDGATQGLRVASRDVSPSGSGTAIEWYTATLHLEENLTHGARWTTNPDSDTTWFWRYYYESPGSLSSYPFDLSALATPPTTATLTAKFMAYTFGPHTFDFKLNGTDLGTVNWVGKGDRVVSFEFSPSLLQEGSNLLELVKQASGGLYIDWIEVDYPRYPVAQDDALTLTSPFSGTVRTTFTGFSTTPLLYDITAPLLPVRLENADPSGSGAITFQDEATLGTTYLATRRGSPPVSVEVYSPPTDVITPSQGADQIVVAPREFFAALEPLLQRRRSQGLRVKTVAVEDAYALFNGGVFHPEAIRSLVAYAHAHWPGPSPRYLLIVGDGNFNFKGYNPDKYGEYVPSHVPPYLDFLDPDQGEVGVDAYFGDVTGDGLPEVAVGRIPADSIANLEAIVDKILAYEDAPPAPWMDRVLHVADDGVTYDEGFEDTVEALEGTYVPPTVNVDSVYISDSCGFSGPCPTATHALTTAWSQGAVLLTYAGHGAVHRWAHEPLLLNTQMADFPPLDELPFLISLDCWDGYWMFPPKYSTLAKDVRSMGEWATTVVTDGAAIAAFGPSGLAYAFYQRPMSEAMYDAIFNAGSFRLGEITQEGRAAIASSYLARTYTLLGDPALTLPLWQELTVTPAVITVTANSTLSLPATIEVTGTTRFGTVFPVTPEWTATGGEVDAWDTYTAPTTAGQYTIHAHEGQSSAPVAVNVVPGAPYTVTVTPDPLVISLSSSAQMTATLTDEWDNPLPGTPAWTADVGEIHPATGLFTAPTRTAQGWITATIEGISGRAWVDVQLSELTTVTVTPDPVLLKLGESVQMTATLEDQTGNPITGEPITWTAEIGAISASGLFTAPLQPAQGWITATAVGVSGRAWVEVRSHIYLPLTLKK